MHNTAQASSMLLQGAAALALLEAQGCLLARSLLATNSSSSSTIGSLHSSIQRSSAAAARAYHGSSHTDMPHGTTVLCIHKDGQVVLMADGQITAGSKVVKPNARKLRRLATEPVPSLGGFAGSTADGLTLFERLEQRLQEHPGQLRRAAVELAKVWRQDRILRHLEATMIVADATTCLEVSGRGELLEPADGVHAIGSGSRFAIAAARALMTVPGLQPLDIAQRAMRIAAEKCVYTNSNFIWECIGQDGQLQSGGSSGSGSSQGGAATQQQQQQQ
ncbi:hypothetical protein OEZ85_007218 [Tetradesmus obliquus]|uniref:Proteasome endopeptidase complex n=1 Tax=Tetradesmus obliquus TaxID=3088 RepID=A0ABY8TZI1_TETOB|nr:hypothetical protein OEZ85_007218 [Tetradesmus obliquus]